jgi:hypothetical protein
MYLITGQRFKEEPNPGRVDARWVRRRCCCRDRSWRDREQREGALSEPVSLFLRKGRHSRLSAFPLLPIQCIAPDCTATPLCTTIMQLPSPSRLPARLRRVILAAEVQRRAVSPGRSRCIGKGGKRALVFEYRFGRAFDHKLLIDLVLHLTTDEGVGEQRNCELVEGINILFLFDVRWPCGTISLGYATSEDLIQSCRADLTKALQCLLGRGSRRRTAV